MAMGRSERIRAFGLAWFRYPDSPRPSDRRYFRGSGGLYLHRLIWEVHHGEIPKGFHVHHKDNDQSNNRIENLQLLAGADHMRLHNVGVCTPAKRVALDRIRELTKAWHASPEGREWHRQHAIEQRARGGRSAQKKCQYCGTDYGVDWPKATDRFCSLKCRAAARRVSGVDDVERDCALCGKPFTINRYTKTRCCSRSCAARLRCGQGNGVQPDGGGPA